MNNRHYLIHPIKQFLRKRRRRKRYKQKIYQQMNHSAVPPLKNLSMEHLQRLLSLMVSPGVLFFIVTIAVILVIPTLIVMPFKADDAVFVEQSTSEAEEEAF